MQRGRIYRHHGSWLLQFYDDVLIDGKKTRKRTCVKLAPANKDYPTKRSVLLLAEKHLSPVNSGQLQPESAILLTDYIEKIYLPAAEKRLRPSTVKDYREIFHQHLKPRLDGLRLRDFRTVHGQRIMASIPDVGHARLLRIKAVLSAAFTHALRTGVLDGTNPVHAVSVPGKPAKFKGHAYSLSEIERMLISTTGVARIVIATAALTGLRLSELRGLRWNDFDGENLQVRRSVWRTNVGPPKTETSEGLVPILPLLQAALKKHRGDASDDAYIFAGKKRGAPLNLHNLAARVIKPSIEKCIKCQKSRSEHKPTEDHKFDLDTQLVWRGWHSFRRGLASNLYALGVQPKVIQAILRHGDIGTTLAYYIQVPNEESRDALQSIEDAFPFGL
jgi:integrase